MIELVGAACAAPATRRAAPMARAESEANVRRSDDPISFIRFPLGSALASALNWPSSKAPPAAPRNGRRPGVVELSCRAAQPGGAGFLPPPRSEEDANTAPARES